MLSRQETIKVEWFYLEYDCHLNVCVSRALVVVTLAPSAINSSKLKYPWVLEHAIFEHVVNRRARAISK